MLRWWSNGRVSTRASTLFVSTVLGLMIASAAMAASPGGWHVSEPDSFGWRRAMIDVEEARLAVVCPPERPPFMVPVIDPRPDGEGGSRLILGLEIEGVRYEHPMRCSELICEADLDASSWQALSSGRAVTVWYDDARGPTFPLTGSADALAACSSHH